VGEEGGEGKAEEVEVAHVAPAQPCRLGGAEAADHLREERYRVGRVKDEEGVGDVRGQGGNELRDFPHFFLVTGDEQVVAVRKGYAALGRRSSATRRKFSNEGCVGPPRFAE